MPKHDFTRREFIGVTAAATGATLAAKTLRLAPTPLQAAQQRPVAPSDRVRFGIIGVGMQGSGLLGTSIQIPGVECAAACDLYDGRHTLAKEIVRPDLPTTRRYKELLDNKNIDCIVAAVPDHWHRQIVIDAVSAGKDIYCEKPMSHSPADGVAMVDAVKKSGRILQIGSQRVSSNVTAKAREMIASGILGDLMLIEGFLGRNDPNGAWQYPPPPDLSPANIDWDTWQGDVRPKRPLDPKLFARWRCWNEYGTGVAGDLLVHLISGMMFMMNINEPPKQAFAVAGIRHFKDGRNMPDVHATNYYYGDLPVYMHLNLATSMPEVYRFQGSKGILEVNSDTVTFSPQTGTDSSPSYYAYSFPKAMREAYFAQWHAENDARVAKEATQQTITFRGHEYDDIEPHLANFFNAVRTRKPVVEDVVFGHHAALACHMANESYFRKNVVTWDEASKTIKG
jgi:predicted dehydrogenase